MSLIAELQRRKVFKVGAGYLVVAWLAVQVASIAFPAFDAPAWALRVFILLCLLGFPLAVVMAWIFDSASEGMRKDPGVAGGKAVFVGAGVLIALALGWYFHGQPTFRKGDVHTPVAAGRHSIAVLPFANMSGSSDQDYFSDGMTEELLNVLAKVPQLHVVARTSVFEFKDKGGDVRAIGRKLGVSHIVEGSVRRDGEQVRIAAKLVRVADGFDVWGETYERKLESVFALQEEIAARIGDALRHSLDVATPVAARVAIDPAAYDDYLKGRALLRTRADLPTAVGHFRAAVARAPSFAAAWSSLSLACEVRFWYGRMTREEQAQMLACEAEAAARAAELDPDSAATEHALANLARARFRFAEAERHYLRGMQLDPGYPDVREDYSELMFEVGRLEDSARAARQLVALDPYFVVGWLRMRDAAVAFDHRADVEEAMRRMLVIAPDGHLGRRTAIEYAVVYGRADEARAAMSQTQARSADEARIVQTLLSWALGDPGIDARQLNAALADGPPGLANTFLVAKADVAGHISYLDELGAIPQAYYFADLNKSKATGHAMLRDPRVKAKLVEYGFEAYWREKGWPAACRPLGKDDFECGFETPAAAAP